ncbi:MAG: hypothetical protein AB7G23_03000 [Vicinamibacterales bacterium]
MVDSASIPELIGVFVATGLVVSLWRDNARLGERSVALAGALARTEAERDYWRERAERLLDGALMRKGEASGPVMAEAPKNQEDRAYAQFAGLAMTEIDSTRTL